MAISVKRYEHIRDIVIPAWSTTWPAVSGCGTRTLYYNGTSSSGPSSDEVVWYEPYKETVIKDNRKLRGYHPGLSFPYSATPRFNSRTITKQFVVKRLDGATSGYRPYQQYGAVERVNGYCTPVVSRVTDSGDLFPMWYENRTTWIGTDYRIYDISSAKVSAADAAVENAVAIDALTSYDLLTEIAECREIPHILPSALDELSSIIRNLSRSFDKKTLKRASKIRPIDLLKHPEKVLRSLGNLWMGYRYAVMPLIYSCRDLVKTINRGVDMTSRKSQTIVHERTSTNLPSASTDYMWSQKVGSVTVRGTVFQKFDWETVAKMSGISVNPFVTAWELIPYSFVFDWFVNVGDYITRTTTMPMNNGYSGCVSIRSKYTTETYIHFKQDNKYCTCWNMIPTNWWGATPPQAPSILIPRPEESQLLQSIEVDEYSRRCMFSLNGANLQVDPSLNWKRLLDGSVMSYNILRGLVNRFLK